MRLIIIIISSIFILSCATTRKINLQSTVKITNEQKVKFIVYDIGIDNNTGTWGRVKTSVLIKNETENDLLINLNSFRICNKNCEIASIELGLQLAKKRYRQQHRMGRLV